MPWLTYNSDLFDASTIHRMAGHFETLLEAIISGDHHRLSDLPLLKGAELRELVTERNSTQKDFARDKCVHQLFETQVGRTPHATAVSYGNDQLTYLELNRRANQLAHHLIAQGVGPDVIVGICAERSWRCWSGCWPYSRPAEHISPSIQHTRKSADCPDSK